MESIYQTEFFIQLVLWGLLTILIMGIVFVITSFIQKKYSNKSESEIENKSIALSFILSLLLFVVFIVSETDYYNDIKEEAKIHEITVEESKQVNEGENLYIKTTDNEKKVFSDYELGDYSIERNDNIKYKEYMKFGGNKVIDIIEVRSK